MSIDLSRLYELRLLLSRLEETISTLRTRLYELEEAKRILESSRGVRKIFRIFGNRIMIEIGAENAKRFLEDEIEAIRLQLDKLEKEYKEKLKELQELERRLHLR